MNVKRLFAIGFIFAMTAAAWFVLATSLLVRSAVKDRLAQRVEERWGGPWVQTVPFIEETGDGAEAGQVEPASSAITVDLDLDYRRMGLLWYATYSVVFDGVYKLANPDARPATFLVSLEPPTARGESSKEGYLGKEWSTPVRFSQLRLDDFAFEEVEGASDAGGGTTLTLTVPAGQSKKFRLHYKSWGRDRWTYDFGPQLRHIRNFNLTATTNFRDVDFATVSPTEPKEETDDGWRLAWKYDSTRAKGLSLTVDMPQRQNPGTLAGSISFFAPVSLLFFLTVMVVITVVKKVEIHPMNYFFLAAAFFAFHLLLAYLVDHIDVQAAFFISAAVSVLLVVTYLRLVTGARFALFYAGTAQLVFLVGFSYAFFYEGFTGLSVTIGAIITLFVLMQVTARVNWSEVFGPKSPAPARPLTVPSGPAQVHLPEDLPRTGPRNDASD
jgi:hypothetical protein